MDEPNEKCWNCRKFFPESKIPTHQAYCRRNFKRCSKCAEMYDINYQEEHEELFHKKAKCEYCNKDFQASDLSNHKNSCNMKTQFCEYCQLYVALKQYSPHLKACESRTKRCYKCRKPIPSKEYLLHLTACPGIIEEPPHQSTRSAREREQNKRTVKANQGKQYKDKHEPFNYGFETGNRYQSNGYRPVHYEGRYSSQAEYNRTQRPQYTHINGVQVSKQNFGRFQQNRETQRMELHKDDPQLFTSQFQNNWFRKDQTQPRKYNHHQEHQVSNGQLPRNYMYENQATQRVILQSMQQLNKKAPSKQSHKLPFELSNPDLLKQSFIRDIDMDEQRRMYEQYEKNANKR